MSERKKVNGYATKYALTTGISRAIGELLADGKYVRADGFASLLVLNRDFFESREAAQADAVKRAKTKIKNTEKLLARLQDLTKSPKFDE